MNEMMKKPTINLGNMKRHIYSFSLDSTFDRLVKVNHWSKKAAREGIFMYRNYLYLRRLHPKLDLPPSKEIFQVWHAHILHTGEYLDFCKKVFPDFKDNMINHKPHRVLRENPKALNKAFEKTQRLYEKEFGTRITPVQSSFLGWFEKQSPVNRSLFNRFCIRHVFGSFVLFFLSLPILAFFFQTTHYNFWLLAALSQVISFGINYFEVGKDV